MFVVWVPVEKIKGFGDGVPVVEIDAAENLISDWRFCQPLLLSHDYEILLGRARFFASLRLGCDSVPAYVLDCDKSVTDFFKELLRRVDLQGVDFLSFEDEV